MSSAALRLVARWHGAYVVGDDEAPVAGGPYDGDRKRLEERLKSRRNGSLTDEELALAESFRGRGLTTRDRRFDSLGLTRSRHGPRLPARPRSFSRALLREILLSDAEERLRASWDPSVHLQETVRAIEELDATLNLLGERLESWSRRDVRDAGLDEVGSTATLATQLAEGRATTDPSLGPVDPAVEEARATLARLYLEVLRSRNRLESSLAEAMPRRAPNLTALLGPTLAARLIAQAGGLDRLARLPASTVQVLGAENAFFEHLRGRGPPPRHGLLFLHPDIQGRPRRDRGKLARALAGKTSIAARLDREGSPLRPELLAEFRARSEAVRQQGKRSAKRPPRR